MPRKPLHPSGHGQSVNLYLPPAHREALRREAERRGVSMSRVVVEWIERQAMRGQG